MRVKVDYPDTKGVKSRNVKTAIRLRAEMNAVKSLYTYCHLAHSAAIAKLTGGQLAEYNKLTGSA